MRLGDLDEAKKIAQEYPSDQYHVITACAVIDKTPTIDPETLPIARQLREELVRVTAERDAAVSDLENIMAYNSDTCQLCKNNRCYVRGGTKPCFPKWRGPQKEGK